MVGVLRLLRRYLGKTSHRLFLLEEYWRGCRGVRMPAHLLREILRKPASAEDWVHLLRFVGPEESVFLVDVGAHVGEFAAGFRACYKAAEVVCVEPASENFNRLAERFAGERRVSCLQFAASDHSGEVEMDVYPAYPSMNTLQRYRHGARPDIAGVNSEQERVRCRPLSTVALPTDRTVVVKIDVQGSEVETINGAGDWFQDVDAVLCEVSFVDEYVELTPSFVTVATRLAAHGLYPVVFQSFGDAVSNYAFERDVLFVRKERLKRVFFENY